MNANLANVWSSMTPTMAIINIYSNLLTAFNFMVIAVALLMFLRRTDIGHRLLIRLVIVFSVSRSIVSWATTWDLLHRFTYTTAVMRGACSMVGTVCVIYFIVSNRDIIRTLVISEWQDRLRKNKLEDAEQARRQMTFLSADTRKKSEALLLQRQIR